MKKLPSESRPPEGPPAEDAGEIELVETGARGGGSREHVAAAGLCALCSHMRPAFSRHSAYLRCALAGRDDRFPRYPRLPVLSCRGFEPAVARE